MAIDLLNSFLKKEQNISSSPKNTSANVNQTLPQNLQVMRMIKSLQAGQTLRGEIVSVNGDEVQLAILKDVIIDAKLDQSMSLTPGTTMPFQVKANNSHGLSLVPLFANTASDPHVMKALEMAKLPVNERSMEMVQTLMEKGMSIDKQALGEIYRDVVGFRDAAVKDIVTLHQLELPVTQDNLTQLSLYENDRHYLSDSFEEIGKAISDQLETWINDGKTEEVKNLLQELKQVFGSEKSQEGSAAAALPEGKNDAEGVLTEKNPEPVSGKDAAAATVVLKETLEANKTSETVLPEQAAKPEQAESLKNQITLPEDGNTEGKETFKTEKSPEQNLNTDWEQFLREVSSEKHTGKIVRAFEKLWKAEVDKNWMLEPEAFLEKKDVKEYFSKLDHQLKDLEKILGENVQKESPAAKTVHNSVSNLDFMNQLNQIHAYVQLPLKMAERNAHGELYVFTNKKSLARQEGKVSALLHLDMEYLGNMDIYVALEEKKVSTNFYLEKEEYLDFIEEHMELLTSRLQKRGYECQVKASLQNQKEEPLMKVIQKEQGQATLLSMQAFDVRA